MNPFIPFVDIRINKSKNKDFLEQFGLLGEEAKTKKGEQVENNEHKLNILNALMGGEPKALDSDESNSPKG